MDGNNNNVVNKQIRYCTYCGKDNDVNNKFCMSCGASLTGYDPNTNAVSNVLVNSDPQLPVNYQLDTSESTQAQNQVPVNNVENNTDNEGCGSFILKGFLGVILFTVSISFPQFMALLLVLSVVMLFFKKTRPIAIAIFSSVGALLFLGFLLLIILFGACFFGLG